MKLLIDELNQIKRPVEIVYYNNLWWPRNLDRLREISWFYATNKDIMICWLHRRRLLKNTTKEK